MGVAIKIIFGVGIAIKIRLYCGRVGMVNKMVSWWVWPLRLYFGVGIAIKTRLYCGRGG